MGGLSPGLAASVEVTPQYPLVKAVRAAHAGDVLQLTPGLHQGPIVLDKPLTLLGVPGAVVEGNGTNSTVTILSSDVIVRGLTVRGSGINGETIDSGIYAEQGADRPVIENNTVDGNLFGIVIHGARQAQVRGNLVRNRTDLWLNDRGNGLHIWNTTGSVFEDNRIESGRDGVFVTVSHSNTIRRNWIENCRIAVHYMYAKTTLVEDNVSVANHVGFALMFSNFIMVQRNISIADGNNGLMLHTIYHSQLRNNRVYGTAGKGMFLYTSSGNIITGNRVEAAGIGVHFTGGANNTFSGNAFVGNRTQMKYSGTQTVEWSAQGHGNYWSDNPAFDLNSDGIADQAYHPNRLTDWITWKYPAAKVLLSSPVLEILRLAQSQFPALYPGGVMDSYPLMDAPETIPLPLPPQQVVKWLAVRDTRLATTGAAQLNNEHLSSMH